MPNADNGTTTTHSPLHEADVDEARAFMQNDAFVKWVGIELVSLSKTCCVCRMPLTDAHKNAVGVAHGGALFTLADYAGACLANAQGARTLGINGYMVYMAATSTGPIEATATLMRAGKTLVHTQVEVKDGMGRLLSTLTTSGFRLEKSAPEST